MRKIIYTFLLTIISIQFCLSQTTLILQPDSAIGKDALLHGLSNEVNRNYGKNGQFVASGWTFDGEPAVMRSIIDFNLKNIPLGAKILNAELSLYAWKDDYNSMKLHWYFDGSNECWLERVTDDWTEFNVKWNNQPKTTTYNRVSIPCSTSQTQDYLNINVTQLVQDIVNFPDSSFGFMLKLKNELYYRNMNFCSSDHPNASLHPKLQVVIDNSTELQEQFSTEPQFLLYPNPIRDKLNIDLNGYNLTKKMNFILYNQLGQEIKYHVIDDNKFNIDLSKTYSGIYTYKFIENNILIKSGLLMVSK